LIGMGKDVAWLDFVAPHKHVVVYVSLISVRTISSVSLACPMLHLPGSLATGAHHAEPDAYLHTAYSLGTTSSQPVREYFPFALEDGGDWLLWRWKWLASLP
jgi:hypothetical protein